MIRRTNTTSQPLDFTVTSENIGSNLEITITGPNNSSVTIVVYNDKKDEYNMPKLGINLDNSLGFIGLIENFKLYKKELTNNEINSLNEDSIQITNNLNKSSNNGKNNESKGKINFIYTS